MGEEGDCAAIPSHDAQEAFDSLRSRRPLSEKVLTFRVVFAFMVLQLLDPDDLIYKTRATALAPTHLSRMTFESFGVLECSYLETEIFSFTAPATIFPLTRFTIYVCIKDRMLKVVALTLPYPSPLLKYFISSRNSR